MSHNIPSSILSPEESYAMLKDAAQRLGEHFDSVQIIATLHDETELGGTVTQSAGTGNEYARHGSVREWLLQKEEECREFVREAWRGHDDE